MKSQYHTVGAGLSALSLECTCAGAAVGGGEVRASFRGVTRLERERKWVARVWNGQKQLTLGRFDTDVAAAQVSCMHTPHPAVVLTHTTLVLAMHVWTLENAAMLTSSHFLLQ